MDIESCVLEYDQFDAQLEKHSFSILVDFVVKLSIGAKKLRQVCVDFKRKITNDIKHFII